MADQMVDYIRNGLKNGYSAESLRNALLNQGYPVAEVSRAFSLVQGPAKDSIKPVYSEKPQPAAGMAKKMTLRRIGVFSSGKISALMGAMLGLLFGIMMTAMTLILGSATSGSGVEITSTGIFDIQNLLMGMGVLSVVVAPIMFAIIGFLGGAVSALIYNVLAGLVGGYEVEFE